MRAFPLIIDAIVQRFRYFIPDRLYLQLRYRCQMGAWPNLSRPTTFQEKIQWLKLNDRNPQYTAMVDKIAAKEYVKQIIGEGHIIPTIAVWDKVEDIEWNILPEQFVLKTTHSGGSQGVIICRDHNRFDKKDAVKKLSSSLKNNVYWNYREWPYKNIKPRIIAEQYMEDSGCEELTDYKFYCFNGEPLYCQVIGSRHSGETIDFFDMDWNHMPFFGLNPLDINTPKAINAKVLVREPASLQEMMKIATGLSQSIPFVRVDLFEINGKTYFGELTFYPASGFGTFTPPEWNRILGDNIKI